MTVRLSVDPERTRFDFTHRAPLTDTEIRRVEAIVNNEILQNAPTNARVLPLLGADIRFVADAAGSGAAMTGIDIRVRNPIEVLESARSLALPVRDGAVAICGVQMRPVQG